MITVLKGVANIDAILHAIELVCCILSIVLKTSVTLLSPYMDKGVVKLMINPVEGTPS